MVVPIVPARIIGFPERLFTILVFSLTVALIERGTSEAGVKTTGAEGAFASCVEGVQPSVPVS